MEFEKAMKRLTEISKSMGGDELPLEDSIKLYSEAAELVKFCKDYIDKAKLKIEQLDAQKSGE